MEVGLVHKIDIDREMQQAYLDYAMSVIVARALPDARDGLKPVQRRILYAMYDMGLRPDSAYKKSARIVGEVMGKYHPHGDMAVYESMARLAQDFSMRYRLVEGQGNFGSVDGDPPAAMRYTEARLANPAMHILTDIDKDTVDFVPNFDDTLKEPAVLPAAIPNMLVNGATGIAVGMATSIPPHNLGEVVDAMLYLLENWSRLDEIGVEDLMKYVQGPDFPTGGLILHQPGSDENLVSAYSTGRGAVTLQARAHLEEMERGRNRIIVSELPYMTNKASLIERIAELAREERIEGIVDLRDESDRQGMRIVIELSKSADPQAVLRDLYKHTPMQTTVSLIMLALVDGEPRMLSLKQALRIYLEHRLEIVRRRSQFELDKARQRAHILEGYRIALAHLDEVIALIRKAPDADTARTRLMKQFKLTEIQAQAILDMPLKRLAALERKKIEDEYKELKLRIKELEAILRSPARMRQVVGEELGAVKQAYADRRRTHIVHLKEGEQKISLLTTSDLIPEKPTWVCITADRLISRMPEDRSPRLGGKEASAWLVRASTRHILYLANQLGEAAAINVHSIPENEDPLLGAPVWKVCSLSENIPLAAAFALPGRSPGNGAHSDLEQGYLLTVSHQGLIKKTVLEELPGASAHTFTLAKVNEGDALGWALVSKGNHEVFLVTAQGMAIRFSEEEVRPMGLAAAGVMGIKLAPGDQIIGAVLLPRPGDVFLVAAGGKAKRVPVDQFPKQGRYGQGVQAWKMTGADRLVGMLVGKGTERATLFMSILPPRAIRLDEAPLQTRAASGKAIEAVKAPNRLTGVSIALDMAEAPPDVESMEKKGRRSAAPIETNPAPAPQTAGKARAAKSTTAAAPQPAPAPAAKRGKASATPIETNPAPAPQTAGKARAAKTTTAAAPQPAPAPAAKRGKASATPIETSPAPAHQTAGKARAGKATTAIAPQPSLAGAARPEQPAVKRGRKPSAPASASAEKPDAKAPAKTRPAKKSPATTLEPVSAQKTITKSPRVTVSTPAISRKPAAKSPGSASAEKPGRSKPKPASSPSEQIGLPWEHPFSPPPGSPQKPSATRKKPTSPK